MTSDEEIITVLMECPLCKSSFKKDVEYRKKVGLFAVLIKSHPNNNGCAPFIAFIDNNGKQRGSQKIDNMDDDTSTFDQLVEQAQKRINEINETLKFYHLKVPRNNGRAFEHKVANVSDRAFMSSNVYSKLINFLIENDENNLFGGLVIPVETYFEGGLLIYGKYMGMSYTLYWRDQKSLNDKNFEELKGFANLTVEQLIEFHDLTDLFF